LFLQAGDEQQIEDRESQEPVRVLAGQDLGVLGKVSGRASAVCQWFDEVTCSSAASFVTA